MYAYFKRLTGEIAYEKSWTWLRKGNYIRKSEFILIATQNNAIRTNYIKTKLIIHNTIGVKYVETEVKRLIT